eukprot:295231-Pelagomonas_calceolata.AAC.2
MADALLHHRCSRGTFKRHERMQSTDSNHGTLWQRLAKYPSKLSSKGGKAEYAKAMNAGGLGAHESFPGGTLHEDALAKNCPACFMRMHASCTVYACFMDYMHMRASLAARFMRMPHQALSGQHACCMRVTRGGDLALNLHDGMQNSWIAFCRMITWHRASCTG